MTQFDICYLVSHGHTARGLTQTDLLGEMVRVGLKVLVISKDSSNDMLKRKCAEAGAHLEFFNIKNSIFSSNYMIFRSYVLSDIKRNPALWEKHLRRIHNVKSSHPWRKLQPILFYYCYLIARYLPFFRTQFKRFESRLILNQTAVELLAKYSPKCIVSSRPVDAMEAAMLCAARKLKIKKILSILSWDNITCKGVFPEAGDYYISWGPIMTQEIKEYYSADPKSIFECGVAHFDVHINTLKEINPKPYLVKLGLDPRKPYMIFTMSAPYFCPNEIDVIEWLAQKVSEDVYGSNMQFIARPHMQNMQGGISDKTWIDRLKKITSDRVSVDFPSLDDSELTWSMKQEDMTKLSHLLAGASVCLNSGSTISIESAILDRPTIMPMFDVKKGFPWWKSVVRIKDFIHMKKFLSYDAVDVANSFEELDFSIKLNLLDGTRKREQRQQVVKMECYKNDGFSTKRILFTLQQLCNNTTTFLPDDFVRSNCSNS